MAACADTVKKCFLELGGKSANVMLDDADFATGIGLGTAYVCTHSGQGCALYTRLLLPRSRYDEGVELATTALTEGDRLVMLNPAGDTLVGLAYEAVEGEGSLEEGRFEGEEHEEASEHDEGTHAG